MSSAPLRFGWFCLASYLLSLSYGATFLLSLLIAGRGGNEQDAGQIISVAMFSTLVAVLGSGHLTDHLGAARSVALSALCLVAASFGFALVPGVGPGLWLCGLLLGLGWGVFYTLGPIMVAAHVPTARRTHSFALLSGSMLSGIGSGPLAGWLAVHAGWPVQSAFYCAGCAAVMGAGYFWWLGPDGARRPAAACISLVATRRVLTSRSALSIVLVGLGGAIFGGLGSFQTSYAASLHLDYSLFFVGFMGAAIACRLLIAGWVVRRDPLLTSWVLTTLMLVAVLAFGSWVQDSLGYLLAAALLGVGYGLNYSVINGLAANEAPAGLTPQALLLFSLAYFLGVFGFPRLAGGVIVHWGIHGMLLCVAVLAGGIWLISAGRWAHDRAWARK
ncbi:MFS transporter [Pseudomonas putida]